MKALRRQNLRQTLMLMATAVVLASPAVHAQTPPAASPPPTAVPPAAPAAPAALPPPVPFRQAFEKAATDVLENAPIPVGTRVELMIDPLIDGDTGAQSGVTRNIEAQIRQLVSQRFASKFEVKPFTADNVARQGHVFIGTFTPIYAVAPAAGQPAAGTKDAYRVCFAIVDLKTKLIVSKGFARATSQGINPVPTPAFAESPVWMKDPAVDGYIKTCQGPKAGDPINAAYVDKVDTASVIAEAIKAYDERRYPAALDLYTKARALLGGDQLRVFNGLYLTNLKLRRTAEASTALGELVEYGLKGDRIGMMLLFVPKTTNFAQNQISQAYPSWLKTVADKSAARNACLEVVGHASHTGTEVFNDRLSEARAASVRARIERLAPQLAKNLKSSGQGWKQNIVGTGRDDASDALDRRVEFKVVKCA